MIKVVGEQRNVQREKLGTMSVGAVLEPAGTPRLQHQGFQAQDLAQHIRRKSLISKARYKFGRSKERNQHFRFGNVVSR